jgi:hypothetical protein
MADIVEFKWRLQQIREALREHLPNIATTLALTAKALAERNIKEKGFGVLYSNNKVPAWFLHGKELNQKGTKFLADRGVNPSTGAQGGGKKKRRKKKGDPDPGYFDKETNWKEFRAAQGLQTAFIDLSYSNKMWANMQVVQVITEALIVKALLGATNREAQNKMNWNRENFGDFIRKALSDADGKILGDLVISELDKVIQQFKL